MVLIVISTCRESTFCLICASDAAPRTSVQLRSFGKLAPNARSCDLSGHAESCPLSLSLALPLGDVSNIWVAEGRFGERDSAAFQPSDLGLLCSGSRREAVLGEFVPFFGTGCGLSSGTLGPERMPVSCRQMCKLGELAGGTSLSGCTGYCGMSFEPLPDLVAA